MKGGQVFLLTVALLTQDAFSLLAACCRQRPPFKTSDEENCIVFDRDWWLFRHIVTFLRTGLLPDEVDTLTELYAEACFFRLESLRRAIEEVPVQKLQPKVFSDAQREPRR